MVYDVTSLESFDHVSSWVQDAINYSRTDLQILLVGNKKDMAQNRVVTSIHQHRLIESIKTIEI